MHSICTTKQAGCARGPTHHAVQPAVPGQPLYRRAEGVRGPPRSAEEEGPHGVRRLLTTSSVPKGLFGTGSARDRVPLWAVGAHTGYSKPEQSHRVQCEGKQTAGIGSGRENNTI